MPAQQHLTRHSSTVDAGVDSIYRIIADVSVWPAVFCPTIYVRLL